uniref:Interferon alpha inducible protein 6 n=1 Tax=Felis catus TaxID=9685 RepID=A0ABI7YYS8_FELCA
MTKPARGATMRRKAVSLFLCHLLLFACGGVEAGKRRQAKEERSEDGGSGVWGALTYMAVGGGLLAAGLPVLGFTSTGIAANSVAAWLMSCSAVANGGGVPAGGLVAVLQSLGMTILSVTFYESAQTQRGRVAKRGGREGRLAGAVGGYASLDPGL